MTVRALFFLQRLWLGIAYALFRLRRRGSPKTVTWAVGVDETATMVLRIGQLIPGSWTVVLSKHPYYAHDYGTQVTLSSNRTLALLKRAIIGPWVFADMLTRARGLIYVGATGYLLVDADRRDFEFAFARARGVKIAAYFVGDDVRAPRLMHQLEREMGLPNLSTKISEVSPYMDSDEYDRAKRAIAEVASRQADVIFTSPTDQLSYLEGHTERVVYYYPDELIGTDESKFDDLSRLLVVHAPSSPIIKGTPLVHAAIERLRSEGYDFEYRELSAVSNDEVLATLRRAHIALNQFYAFQTGVFAIEAMAARCAVLMSADEHIEKVLPAGSNDAWLVTKYDQVYVKLKSLLDDPAAIEPLARRGEQWVRDNAAFSSSGPELRRILTSVLEGTYKGR